jgi:protein associated with RNAse G/E
MPTRPVAVRFQRYDGLIKRAVTAQLIEDEQNGEIRLAVPFGSVFQTLRGPWTPPTAAIYHFWRGAWHNACTIVSPQTRRPAFLYCDIHAPLSFDGNALVVLDLDLDVIVHPDRSFRVLDEEEFAANSARFGYPPALIAGAEAALATLTESIREKRGPFATARLFSLAADEAAALQLPSWSPGARQ